MATNQVFVYTMNRGIQGGSWSRYIFPWNIEHFAHFGDHLYLRHGDTVSKVVHGQTNDDGAAFDGTIHWPWLDFGEPGRSKSLLGFDLSGFGIPNVQFGMDQSDFGAFTAAFTLPADTVPGQVISFPMNVPSLSVKLVYPGNQDWKWNSMTLYLQDLRTTS